MRRDGELVHKLFTQDFCGAEHYNPTSVIADAPIPIHATAARGETVFVGSSGTSAAPLSRKRLRESTPSPRDPSRTFPRRRPSRKPRSPIPEKTSALRARPHEEAFPHRHWPQARQGTPTQRAD